MIDSLNERIRRDERLMRSSMERYLEIAGVLTVAILLFILLYLVILFLV